MLIRSKFNAKQIDALLDLVDSIVIETPYKYYDCFLGDMNNEHDGYYGDLEKIVDFTTGETTIAPEGYNYTGDTSSRVAIAFDLSKKIYINGEWVPIENFLSSTNSEGFDFNAHPEITEEEFYHIPEDEYYYDTPEDAEKLFNRVDAIVEKYRVMGLTDEGFSGMPLAPWIKMINRDEDYTIANLPVRNANIIAYVNTNDYDSYNQRQYCIGSMADSNEYCIVNRKIYNSGEVTYEFEETPETPENPGIPT